MAFVVWTELVDSCRARRMLADGSLVEAEEAVARRQAVERRLSMAWVRDARSFSVTNISRRQKMIEPVDARPMD